MTSLRKGRESGNGGADGVEKIRGSGELLNLKRLAENVL